MSDEEPVPAADLHRASLVQTAPPLTCSETTRTNTLSDPSPHDLWITEMMNAAHDSSILPDDAQLPYTHAYHCLSLHFRFKPTIKYSCQFRNTVAIGMKNKTDCPLRSCDWLQCSTLPKHVINRNLRLSTENARTDMHKCLKTVTR